ncbi:MAG: hypothetical protein ACPK7O_03910 [Methanobacterium sp.]
MSLKDEVDKIYGKNPSDSIEGLKGIYAKNGAIKESETKEKNQAITLNELKNIYNKTHAKKKEYKGYLVCRSCSGYYELKNGESPDDFKGCECGNALEYHENIDILKNYKASNSVNSNSSYKKPVNDNYNDLYYDEYEDLQQMVEIIRVKAEKRQKFLENLYKNIKKQEKILNSIKQEKILDVKNNTWSLWNVMEERNIKDDINNQKMLIDDVIEQEKHLISYIKDKREIKVNNYNNIYSYAKIGILTLIIAFLSIIAIYALK